MDTRLIDAAEGKAHEVLRRCLHPSGFKAASKYYPDVWTRDAVVTSVGALCSEDPELLEGVRQSLETMGKHMSARGHVLNWHPLREDFPRGMLNGAIDTNLWYLVGHWMHYRKTGDKDFVKEHIESMEKALGWLFYQDSNECGLLESHECYDWADLFPNRFNVLLPNVLFVHSLRGMAEMLPLAGKEGSECAQAAKDVEEYVRLLFWVTGEHEKVEKRLARMREDHGEWAVVYRQMASLFWNRDYFMAYVTFRVPPEDRFDTLGNMIAILTGVADAEQTGRILDYVHTRGIADPFPCRANYPVIQPGNPDWRPYLLNREYCRPYSGHNGGVWPFVGGFYVCALAAAGRRAEAEGALERLALANRQGAVEWEFNELLHGETGRPVGAAEQAWSAGMFLAALSAVREERNVFHPDAP